MSISFHIDAYFRHSDDYPPAQIMMVVLLGSCSQEVLNGWIEDAEEALEDLEDEGVYRVSFRGSDEDDVAFEIERVAELEQAVALVCVAENADGEVDIVDAHVDPLIAAVDPDVMDRIAEKAADAFEQRDQVAMAADGGGMGFWLFIPL